MTHGPIGFEAAKPKADGPPVRNGEQGYALVAVMIISTMLLTLGSVGIRSAQMEIKVAGNELHAQQALAVAEAGLEHAVSVIAADNDGFNDELAGVGTGGALAAIGSKAVFSGGSYRFRSFGGRRSTDGYYVHVEDNYDEINGVNDSAIDSDSTVQVRAIGRVGTAERIVETTLSGGTGFSANFLSDTDVTITGGSVVDTYDSSFGPYDPSKAGSDVKVRANGNITLNGTNTTVKGDTIAGGMVKTTGGATVLGKSLEAVSPPESLTSVAPCGPGYSSGAGLSGSYSYNPAKGELKVTGGGSVTLANGQYCFSSIAISGQGTLAVNGPVQIYVTGDASLSGGGVQNTSKLSSNLKLNSSSTGDVSISGGSLAYMVVYAPKARVKFTGGSDFFGAVVGKEIENKGGTKMHGDKTLLGKGTMTRRSWREVRSW